MIFFERDNITVCMQTKTTCKIIVLVGLDYINGLVSEKYFNISEKAPGGGVYFFARLKKNSEKKTPPPGVFSEKPL